MAFGRTNNINGFMPKSISRDMGKTWTYSAGEFPPISSGQRLVCYTFYIVVASENALEAQKPSFSFFLSQDLRSDHYIMNDANP